VRPANQSRLWVIDGILMFVIVLWTAQLFLIITGLDAYLGGEHGILWPAAISSIVIAAICVRLVALIKD
jgi:hypothetical protein